MSITKEEFIAKVKQHLAEEHALQIEDFAAYDDMIASAHETESEIPDSDMHALFHGDETGVSDELAAKYPRLNEVGLRPYLEDVDSNASSTDEDGDEDAEANTDEDGDEDFDDDDEDEDDDEDGDDEDGDDD